MNNIILIGFMGCGKTSVAVKMSYRLKQAMTDTDKWIEQHQKLSISEIFDKYGEPAFRDMETEALKSLKDSVGNKIIATGGGMPLKEENRKLLKEIGTVVYLRVKPETVYERLKNDTTRPLLQGEDPAGKIRTLLESRKEAYEQAADIIVDVDEKSLDEIVRQIEDKMETYSKDFEKKEAEGKKLLVINGPNLNFLGIRDKNIYGRQDYSYLVNLIQEKGKKEGCQIEVFQSNYEGGIIDRIQAAYFDGTEGIVINPGAYTHYSYAIRDALESITVPKVEIHISNIMEREEFRHVSVTAPVCDKQIYGQGLDGYLQAIDFILTFEKKS